jgi:hypothetical protein
MVSVALGISFMWCWLGVAFLTNLGGRLWGARGLQRLLIFCCYLQWLSHVGQLCVVFLQYFATWLCLVLFLQWIWHTSKYFVAIYNQSEPISRIQLLCTIVLACYPILCGGPDRRPSRTHRYKNYKECLTHSVRRHSTWEHLTPHLGVGQHPKL